MARKEGGDPLEGVKGKEHPLGRTSIPPLTRLPHEIGDWRSEIKIESRRIGTLGRRGVSPQAGGTIVLQAPSGAWAVRRSRAARAALGD